MIRDIYPGSRIPDPDFSIQDPGVKKQKDVYPGRRICIFPSRIWIFLSLIRIRSIQRIEVFLTIKIVTKLSEI